MRRRSLLFLGTLAPFALFTFHYLDPRKSKGSSPADYIEHAQRLNQFASNIHTAADARRFVDFVAELFAEQASPSFTNSKLRDRIAAAEFSAVSDSQKLIPELRIVEAWNAYVDTVRAPEDRKVSSAEVHNLRDAFLNSARMAWNRGQRQIWTVASIYATQHNGGLAPGCRAIESIRILWDLANMPENLRLARERVSKGVLASDLFRPSNSSLARRGSVVARVADNPMRIAAKQ